MSDPTVWQVFVDEVSRLRHVIFVDLYIWGSCGHPIPPARDEFLSQYSNPHGTLVHDVERFD